jgi:pimeloyl-ACP methyl ester carboxylesterase
MEFHNFETGVFLGKYPYVKEGIGTKNLVLFRPTGDLRVSIKMEAAEEIQLMRKFVPESYTLYILGYDPHLDKDFTKEQVAHDYATFIKERMDKVTIVAISFGGFVAIPFAALYPELMEKLILLITGYKVSESGEQFSQTAIDLAKAGKAYELDQHITTLYGKWWSRKLFHFITWLNRKKTMKIMNPLSTLIYAYEHMLITNGENKKYLSKIQAPTLVLGGTKDIVFSGEIYTETAQLIPKGKLILYEGESHMVPIEKMKDVKQKVVQFLLNE